MKTIILNGSPRKNWNTALMLKEAEKGADRGWSNTWQGGLVDYDGTK